ncbi:PREDICTED: DUF674 [Prunus dulcis]|uniref:PREDICTED: DUF674 n=1 Tax=Prunus dulcis TaxID=3755 RepID=A0A5E4GKN1_PRUDU|nr:PREDICTED: DUF674 [Prunus dulcis]
MATADSDSNSSNTNTTSVSMKLLVDSTRGKVLFAEASKDVVDFLFTLLSLPVGTVIRLLSKDGMVGSLGKLYESVENLDDTYLQPNLNKNMLLEPKATVAGANILPLLTNDVDSNAKKFYMCSYCSNRSISNVHGTPCPDCNHGHMSNEVTYVSPAPTVARPSEGGYVKGVVTYMVMDDLEVKPMSTISSIAMLNKFNVKEVGALEEKVVNLGMEEGLKLLKASLETSTVLTKVFLGLHVSELSPVCGRDDPRAICSECNYTLSTEVPYVAAQATAEGSLVWW